MLISIVFFFDSRFLATLPSTQLRARSQGKGLGALDCKPIDPTTKTKQTNKQQRQINDTNQLRQRILLF
jgi:hypothetical protein